MLYLIYLDQGIHFWFLLHLLVALMMWAAVGTDDALSAAGRLDSVLPDGPTTRGAVTS